MNLPAEMLNMLEYIGAEGDDLSSQGSTLYVNCYDPDNAFRLRDLIKERDEWDCTIIAHPDTGEPILEVFDIIQQ